jgi:hypothetical protein
LQLLAASGEGRFVEATSEGAIEWFLSPTPAEVSVDDLPFEPVTLDGACEIREDSGGWTIRTGGPRFGVRAANGNGRPVAVISSVAGGALGQAVQLDGRGSCDPEDLALTYAWSLLAAPAGSRWPLAGTSSAQATLTPDVAGIYRVALRVTDSQGAVSDPALLEIEVEDP